MSNRGKFNISRSSSGFYSFQFVAPNGEILLKSDAYISLKAAENALSGTMALAQLEENYEKITSPGGMYLFVIKSNNGAVMASSEQYTSVANRDKAIEVVKKLLANTQPETKKSFVPGLVEFVKAERKKTGLSQEELAIKAGVGKRFILDLERGKQTLRLDKVNQVLRLFGHEMKPQPFDKNDEA